MGGQKGGQNQKTKIKATEYQWLSFSFGDSVGIRTQDPQLRRLLLYPAELRNRYYCHAGGSRSGLCRLPVLDVKRRKGT